MSDTFPTNPPSLALCAQTTELWDSGDFQYDFAGDIVSIGADNFFYDRLSRLKEARVNRHPHDTFANGPQPAGSVTLDYAYDGFGNITDRRLTAMTNYMAGANPRELFGGRNYTPGVAPVTDNQIHEAGFLYDANGNLISDGKKDFIYDELNQQIEVRAVTTSCAAAGDGSGSFESSANAGEGAIPHGTLCYGRGTLVEKNGYDGGGMRVVRETYDPVTSFPKRTIYARLGGSVVKEYTQEYRGPISPAPELSHEKAYIYGPLGLLATEELCTFNCKSDESAGVNITRYYEYDHLGTVRAITNGGGALETTFDYEPFGLELKSAIAPWATDTSSNTHRFTGHERDEEAGEDYMKARMYVLSTARFPQIDPLFGGAGNPQNWNPYIYVLNSPVGASDPTGMLTKFFPEGEKFSGYTSLFDASGGGLGPVSPTIGNLTAAQISYLQSLGFTLLQIQNFVNFGVNSSTTITGEGVVLSPSPSPAATPVSGSGAAVPQGGSFTIFPLADGGNGTGVTTYATDRAGGMTPDGYNATAYVFETQGNSTHISKFDMRTIPSDTTLYGTQKNGTYNAVDHMHNSSYDATHLVPLGTTYDDSNARIPSVGINPYTNKTYLTQVDVHHSGLGDITGFTRAGNPISMGCQLIRYSEWSRYTSVIHQKEDNITRQFILDTSLNK